MKIASSDPQMYHPEYREKYIQEINGSQQNNHYNINQDYPQNYGRTSYEHYYSPQEQNSQK